MDKILHTNDSEFAKRLFNDGVVSQRNALLVDLGESTLVDQLTHRLEVGISPGNVRADPLEHLQCGLGQANESGRVDLSQSQKLQDLSWLWGNLVDTLDTDNKGKLGLSRDIETVLGLGLTAETNLITFFGKVFLNIRFGTLENGLALGLVVL